VDPTGDVAEAAVERSFSPYFSQFALQAARQQRVRPTESASGRTLQAGACSIPAMAQEFEHPQPKVFDNRAHNCTAQFRRLIPAELFG
jgi:hypothetical protein